MRGLTLSLIYRGPLATCPYRCPYCSVRARRPRASDDTTDAHALERFLRWIEERPGVEALSVLFAPRGEALVHRRYRDALVRLAAAPHVKVIAAQTNLAFDPALLDRCDPARTWLWTTFHPTETDVATFTARSAELDALGLRHSAGALALVAHLSAIEALRHALPASVYLWLNRPHGAPLLDPPGAERVRAIDPYFRDRPPRSRGRSCAAGSTAFVVDGDGALRRCLALQAPIGNLYAGDVERLAKLGPAPCPAPVCRCHLGQISLDPALAERFGDGLLARVPRSWAWTH